MKKDGENFNKKGFILVEMLVAVFMFTIVMLVSMTAVLALIDANKKNQGMKSVINNLNLVVNGMAKNLAVGTKYYCGDAGEEPGGLDDYVDNDDAALDCTDDSAEAITFTFNKDAHVGAPSPDVIIYRLGDTVDFYGNPVKDVERSIDGGPFVPITSPEVHITGLQFYVFDTDSLTVTGGGGTGGDTKQPRVIMTVSGYAGVKETLKTKFNIQTTVSQRKLDAIYP